METVLHFVTRYDRIGYDVIDCFCANMLLTPIFFSTMQWETRLECSPGWTMGLFDRTMHTPIQLVTMQRPVDAVSTNLPSNTAVAINMPAVGNNQCSPSVCFQIATRIFDIAGSVGVRNKTLENAFALEGQLIMSNLTVPIVCAQLLLIEYVCLMLFNNLCDVNDECVVQEWNVLLTKKRKIPCYWVRCY